jgi:hypothetical protein
MVGSKQKPDNVSQILIVQTVIPIVMGLLSQKQRLVMSNVVKVSKFLLYSFIMCPKYILIELSYGC